MKNPEFGESYDYDIHQKVSGSGGSIEQVLLAGLYNAAGENVRAAIVEMNKFPLYSKETRRNNDE